MNRSRAALATLAVPLAVAAAWTTGCSGGTDTTASSTTSTTAATTTTGLPANAEAVGLRDLAAGQCFLLPVDDPDAVDRAAWVVPCTDPHTHEVDDVITYAGQVVKGGGYPGTAVVQDWAEQMCFDRFEAFVGAPWTTSSYEIETWWPSEESWGRSDRKVICTVFPEDGGRTTGSARGTAD